MSNVDAPRGFRPIRHRSGLPWNGSVNRYVIPSSDNTATFVGDAVKLAGTADTTGKIPGVIQATSGAAVVGVIVAFEANFDALTTLYRTALTERYCYVVDDPSVLFAIQDDGDSDTMVVGDIGLNANFVVGSGSTTTGRSGMELNTNTAAGTSTLDLKIHALLDTPNNEIGDYGDYLVSFNNHQFANQVSGL